MFMLLMLICMYPHEYMCVLHVHIDIVCISQALQELKLHKYTDGVQAKFPLKTCLAPTYCLGGKITTECNLSMVSSKEKLCVKELPSPLFPFLSQAPPNKLVLWPQMFCKITKLQLRPCTHTRPLLITRLKGGIQHQLTIPGSAGSISKVTGVCYTLTSN